MLYPVFLDLRGACALVVGGGEIGLRRARALRTAGAEVRVVSPEVHPDLEGLISEDLDVTLIRRAFMAQDLDGVRLAFACANSKVVNDAVAAEARARGVWCNHASQPEKGDLRLGATLARGPLQVAVSSGAELPHLAQALRDKLARALPEALPVDAWAARRRAALELPPEQRELVLSTLKGEIRRTVGV